MDMSFFFFFNLELGQNVKNLIYLSLRALINNNAQSLGTKNKRNNFTEIKINNFILYERKPKYAIKIETKTIIYPKKI
jgi:hypothetical protein